MESAGHSVIGVIFPVKFINKIFLVALLSELLIFIFVIQHKPNLKDFNNAPARNCDIYVEEKTVRGKSLTGIVEPGDIVAVASGFYGCHPIERGDIVAFKSAADKNPVIKVVRGRPGDSFSLKETGSGWNILVNNQILKTGAGTPYLLTAKTRQVLAGFEESYNGFIPKGAYLLMGSLPGGALDSTRFGLINKSDIIGKVFKENKND